MTEEMSLTRTGAAHTHSSLTVVSAVGGCGSAGTAGRVLFGSFCLWFLGSTSGYRCMLKIIDTFIVARHG